MSKQDARDRAINARELNDKIVKTYKRWGVTIALTDWNYQKGRFRFKVKLKGRTRKAEIRTRAPDVQSRLKLPIFQVIEEQLTLYIIVSEQEAEYPRLLKILDASTYDKILSGMRLPYVVGHNIMGEPVIIDLADLPHLLLGGSTNSGKSVGLRALITAIIYTKLPSKVNFILIDVGAGDLMVFNDIPHLSCPIVRDHETALAILLALKDELERRIILEHGDPVAFRRLPRLVLVIDEFPALFLGTDDKDTQRQLRQIISSLLQRGRHGKIHLVLAAQNPTFQNMKIDLGNITARIAFRCAKKNFSETILGESGAENLRGQGVLLLKTPQADSLQWVQGIYAKPKAIQEAVQALQSPYYVYDMERKFSLTPLVSPSTGDLRSGSHSLTPIAAGLSEQEITLASVLFWAFSHDHISTNMLMGEHHMGWNKATGLINQLEALGIVDALNGKQPRRVRPRRIEDLTDELVKFMEKCDYPRDALADAFEGRIEITLNRNHHKNILS